MANSYYQDLIKQIEDLIKLEKYAQANELIENELTMPYVPSNVLTRLNEIKEDIKGEVINVQDLSIKSLEQLESMLKANNETSAKAICQLSYLNIRNYLNVIMPLLIDKQYQQFLKVAIIEILVNQGISQDIQYVSQIGKALTFNPTTLPLCNKQDNYLKAIKMLSEKVTKDPSFLNLCQSLLDGYALDIYPDLIKQQDVIPLVDEIISIVAKSYDNPDYTKFIE